MLYLVSPYMDKNFSIQACGPIVTQVNDLFLRLRPDHMFRQGYSETSGNQWIMLEFWTHDQSYMLDVLENFAEHLDCEYDLVDHIEKDVFFESQKRIPD